MSDHPPPVPPAGAHVPVALLDRYAAGVADPAGAVALERHVEGCPACRAALGASVAPDRLAASWDAVAGELLVPRRGPVERALVRLGLRADTVRLMAATPSLRRSWYLALTAALLFGVIAAGPNRPAPSAWSFLALAPLIPVLGVALAYGRGSDPAYEITAAAPLSGLRLVLLRAVTVVGTSIALIAAAALLIPRQEAVVLAAWLVPALSLSTVCLALSTWLPPKVAAWVVSIGWLVGVTMVSGAVRTDRLAGFGPATQLTVAVLGVVAAGVVAARRRAFDEVVA